MVLNTNIEKPEHYSYFGRSKLIPEGLVAEDWYKNLNGTDRYLIINAAPVYSSNGELLAVIETLQDITERKEYEIQLEFHANHDQLTGLPNRNLLEDRIHQGILLSTRNNNRVAVIFIDLDHFKIINDSLGYSVGDEALKIIARRISSCMRVGDTVARHGGDEFVVVISDPKVSDYAAQIAEKIQRTISEPFKINEHEIYMTCSIGISIFPREGKDVQTLLKNADVAMYRAKEMGRNNFQFHAKEMNARSLAHLSMEKHLRKALDKKELSLYYQPKVSLSSGRITGMEALLRWNSPELGMVSPSSFIPLAEETGLIVQIGEWVLKTACSQNKSWQDFGLDPVPVAINLSARQFRQADITSLVESVLKETGLDPKYLEIEITESLVMENTEKVMGMLRELKSMGIQLAMDDFGTGYSSLAYLNRFPFDNLKIDLSFVRDITNNPNSAAIAKTIIAMAHSMRMKVTAEGVETEGQMKYLRDHKCDEMQGYFFSRPLPANEFQTLLRSGRLLNFGAENALSRNKTILLVDDEEYVISAMKRVLSINGYNVLTAGSAAEGFELLACNRVAVVISDQKMPMMNGTDFLSRVKEIYPDTVRILITGYADLNAVTDAINKGAIYKFLTKPWDNDVFLEKISESLMHYELNNKNEHTTPYLMKGFQSATFSYPSA